MWYCKKGSSPLTFQLNERGLSQGWHWVGRPVSPEYHAVSSEPCCPCVA